MVWWEKGAQPPQLLASGEVVMTDAYNGRIAAANDKDKKNFKIVWTNNLYTIDSWVIMKGSPNKAEAEKYLLFVNDPQNQKNLPPKIPYGVTAKASTALIDKNVLPNLATAPQNIASALYINDKFWLENLDKLPSASTPGSPNSRTEAREGAMQRGAAASLHAALASVDKDAAGLRRALRRSRRREQLRAATLVLPLFVFLAACFVVPIGAMLVARRRSTPTSRASCPTSPPH